jgi:hypothetical protein
MMPILDNCIKKYKPCWAGDIKTALCMRDAGVLIENVNGNIFNRDPPNSDYGFPANPCQNPITFHHLLVGQIQKLYHHEREMHSKGKDVNFGNILADWDGYPDGVIVKGDRKGTDYHHEFTKSEKECMERCKVQSRCKSFAFSIPDSSCWYKEGVPALTESQTVYSGHFANTKYKCDSKE